MWVHVVSESRLIVQLLATVEAALVHNDLWQLLLLLSPLDHWKVDLAAVASD